MKFLAPILQYVIAGLLLALIGGGWKVYADVQNVKSQVGSVKTLKTEIQSLNTQLSTLTGNVERLQTSTEAIEKRVDRRLADVPLCRRR